MGGLPIADRSRFAYEDIPRPAATAPALAPISPQDPSLPRPRPLGPKASPSSHHASASAPSSRASPMLRSASPTNPTAHPASTDRLEASVARCLAPVACRVIIRPPVPGTMGALPRKSVTIMRLIIFARVARSLASAGHRLRPGTRRADNHFPSSSSAPAVLASRAAASSAVGAPGVVAVGHAYLALLVVDKGEDRDTH